MPPEKNTASTALSTSFNALLPYLPRVRKVLESKHLKAAAKLYRFILILKGTGAVNIGGSNYILSSKSILLLKPGIQVKTDAANSLEMLEIQFEFSVSNTQPVSAYNIHKKYISFIQSQIETAQVFTIIGRSQMLQDALRLKNTVLKKNAFSSVFSSITLLTLLSSLFQEHYFAISTKTDIKQSTSKRDRQISEEILNLFFKNYYEDLDLDAVFSKYNLHPNHVRSIFKKTVGISARQALLNIRLKEAKKLAETTDLNLTQIAHRTGFRDYFNFLRRFKSKWSVSLGSLRKIK